MQNKRGMNTVMVICSIFIAFFVIIFYGIFLYTMKVTDNELSKINLNVGAISFNQTYNSTLKQGFNSFYNNVDYAGISFLFGMILIMAICGYSFRKTTRLWIIIDICIIILAYIISVYLQNSYYDFIHSDPNLLSIYSTNFSKSSNFILKLPFIVPVIGIIIMIVTYATINKKKDPNTFDYIEQ